MMCDEFQECFAIVRIDATRAGDHDHDRGCFLDPLGAKSINFADLGLLPASGFIAEHSLPDARDLGAKRDQTRG